MPNTLNRGYPYPGPTSPNNVPYDLQQLAEAVDEDMTTALTLTAGTITYLTGWRAPTVSGGAGIGVYAPMVLSKNNGIVTLRAGAIENSVTTTLGGFGQSNGFTVPVGFRPVQRVAIPATVNVQGAFLAMGQVTINPSGTAVLQTTTAWSSVPAGNGTFNAGTAQWVAA